MGMRIDRYNAPEGEVVLQWPDNVSRESAADINNWLYRLMDQKMKRTSGSTPDRPINITNGVPSEDYVRALRDDDNT